MLATGSLFAKAAEIAKYGQHHFTMWLATMDSSVYHELAHYAFPERRRTQYPSVEDLFYRYEQMR